MGKFLTSVIRLARARQLRRWFAAVLAVGTTAALVTLGGFAGTPAASASQPPVGLGTATSFAVLAGTTITNTGSSTISGDLGLSPGTAVTGFPPGIVTNGTKHITDAVALQAQTDLITAYNDAAGRGPATAVSGNLGGQTLGPGVYNATSLGVTGTVYLDAQNDPNAVFIFQAGSTLITASNSTVQLVYGATPCNVFWQVGSSATLGTNSTFVGSILALTSATLNTGASVAGRVLARNGAVTLDDSTISVPTSCLTTPTSPITTTITTSSSGSSITLGNSVNDVATVTGNATDGTPTGSVQFYESGPGGTSYTPSSGTALTPVQPLIGGIATSPSFTPNAVGTYFFAAVYTPSSGSSYAGSSENGSTTDGELFAVTTPVTGGGGGGGPIPTPTSPTTTTIATSPSGSSITLGNSVNDVVTVTGNATDGTPTGSVQFYESGPGGTSYTPSSGTALTPVQPLIGGIATSPSFTPNAVGTYFFAAVYTPSSGSSYAGSSENGSTTDGELFAVTTPVTGGGGGGRPIPTTPHPTAPSVAVLTAPSTAVLTAPSTAVLTAPSTAVLTAPSAAVPSTHTGEPWAGWFYWLLVAMAGVVGLGLVVDRVYRRHVSRRTAG